MKNKLVALFLCLSLQSACSPQSVYQTVQTNTVRHCWKLPESERETCLQRAGLSYEEYERERRKIKKPD